MEVPDGGISASIVVSLQGGSGTDETSETRNAGMTITSGSSRCDSYSYSVKRYSYSYSNGSGMHFRPGTARRKPSLDLLAQLIQRTHSVSEGLIEYEYRGAEYEYDERVRRAYGCGGATRHRQMPCCRVTLT